MSPIMDTPSFSHRQAWDLIPWFVNGSATAAERELVGEHLRTCADCRDEYAFQSRLQAGMNTESMSERDPQPAFRRLLERIDTDRADDGLAADTKIRSTPHASHRHPRRSAHRGSTWTRYKVRVLAAVVIAQSVGLVVLASMLPGYDRSAGSNARYATLSEARAASVAASIRFVPEPTLSVAAMQAILADAKVHIVESNPGSSIYGLAPDPDSRTATTTGTPANGATTTAVAIAHLRARQGVLLAEPIVAPTTTSR
jgi:hypothetical protein